LSRQDHLRSEAGYNRSVAGVLISVFCAGAAAIGGVTALGKLVYDMTHSKLGLGLLGLAEFAPAALLVLVTGAVADRIDKRKVSVAGLVAEAIAAVALALYAHGEPTSTMPIFGLVIVFGIGRAFTAPATRALPSSIMRADSLPWLVARFSATWQAALIVGPVLAGFLYAADPALPFVGMAVLLDLRLLGLTLRRVSVQELTDRLMPFMITGFVIMFSTGILLFYAIPVRSYQNVFFRAKLVFLVIAGFNAWYFHRGVYRTVDRWERSPVAPRPARVAGAVSLVMWAAIIVAGRLIAYNWFDCDIPQSAFIQRVAGCTADQ